MGKQSGEGALYKEWCAHGPFGSVWFVHRVTRLSARNAQISKMIRYDYSNYEKRRVHMRCVIRVKKCV